MTENRYSSNLTQLLKGICQVPAGLNTQVHGLQVDSRKVKKGDLFIALAGHSSASTDHVEEALRNGANAVAIDSSDESCRVFEDRDAVEVFVPNLKAQVGEIANRFFGFPSHELSVIGVTGTNGKTSVSHYIAQYFNLHDVKMGVIGTLGVGFPGAENELLEETGFTTPDVVEMHRSLAFLRDQGASGAAIEVSSHGISQGRIAGVRFEGAVFTNLSHDHLDYHGTMEAYANTKMQLFSDQGLRFAVLNYDDEYCADFKAAVPVGTEVYLYSAEADAVSADVYVTKVNYEHGIEAEIQTPDGVVVLNSSLMGQFNLSNTLALAAVAIAKGHSSEKLSKLGRVTAVEGRMELIEGAGKPRVVVDYAHTPDALAKVLAALRPHCRGKLSVVFGCGGDRDAGKRPEMARIAEQLSDNIIVTTDNPRSENPSRIADDIFAGFVRPAKVRNVADRKQAIAVAIEGAKVEDVVLIAGKGHEKYQDVKGVRNYFSDKEEAMSVLEHWRAPMAARGLGCD